MYFEAFQTHLQNQPLWVNYTLCLHDEIIPCVYMTTWVNFAPRGKCVYMTSLPLGVNLTLGVNLPLGANLCI